jgi:hypothetical protein
MIAKLFDFYITSHENRVSEVKMDGAVTKYSRTLHW